MSKFCYYRISTSLAGLTNGNFIARKLPPVDLVTYDDFSTRRGASQGGESRQGYKSCSLLWNKLTENQAYTLFKIISDAEAIGGQGNGTIYLTFPKVDASKPGPINWIDVSGIVQLPNFETEQQSNGLTYVNVVLTLNNVTAENEPSTAVSDVGSSI